MTFSALDFFSFHLLVSFIYTYLLKYFSCEVVTLKEAKNARNEAKNTSYIFVTDRSD